MSLHRPLAAAPCHLLCASETTKRKLGPLSPSFPNVCYSALRAARFRMLVSCSHTRRRHDVGPAHRDEGYVGAKAQVRPWNKVYVKYTVLS